MKRMLAKLLFGVMLIALTLSPAALMEEMDIPAEETVVPAEAADAVPVEDAAEEPIEAAAESAEGGETELTAEPDVELMLDSVEPDVEEVTFDLVDEAYSFDPMEEETSTPAMFDEVPDPGVDGIDINDAAIFPDPAFRDYISQVIDADEDGFLSDDEIEAVDEISLTYTGLDGKVVSWGVTDLTGIDIFKNVKNLDCSFITGDSLTLDIHGCQSLGNIDLY